MEKKTSGNYKLGRCSNCGHQVSLLAPGCPACGTPPSMAKPQATKHRLNLLGSAAIAGLLMFVGIKACTGSSPVPETQAAKVTALRPTDPGARKVVIMDEPEPKHKLAALAECEMLYNEAMHNQDHYQSEDSPIEINTVAGQKDFHSEFCQNAINTGWVTLMGKGQPNEVRDDILTRDNAAVQLCQNTAAITSHLVRDRDSGKKREFALSSELFLVPQYASAPNRVQALRDFAVKEVDAVYNKPDLREADAVMAVWQGCING